MVHIDDTLFHFANWRSGLEEALFESMMESRMLKTILKKRQLWWLAAKTSIIHIYFGPNK